MAVKSGKITDVGYSNSYGYYVKYKTYDKYDILCAHLDSVTVKKGDNVIQGDVVAYSGYCHPSSLRPLQAPYVFPL